MDKEKLPQTLRRYAHLIDSLDDERAMGNGYWVYLVPGWISQQETHQVHEDNLKQCALSLAAVIPCICEECKQMAAQRKFVAVAQSNGYQLEHDQGVYIMLRDSSTQRAFETAGVPILLDTIGRRVAIRPRA